MRLTKYIISGLLGVQMLVGHAVYSHGNEVQAASDSVGRYKDMPTVHLFEALKALTRSDFTMFGMANALTISYNGGPQHAFTDASDCKDVTGSHPAFIESDFMWYDNKSFQKNDTTAMREAYKRGAVVGYCYHLRGLHSGDFYAYKNNVLAADKDLVKEILASANRDSNASLQWYLTKLDKEVIPVFKGLGFPIIYRPFHEMTGSWFWWGTATCTPDEYIRIYRLTVDYLRAHDVKNVLYAWAPDKSTDMKFYPGDNYIDIIGYDGYDVGIASYHSISLFVANVGTLATYAAGHNKVAAVTEVGYGKYPEAHPDFWLKHVWQPLKKSPKAAKVAWIMTWYAADWNHNQSGSSWIPYTGIDKKSGGAEALLDFKAFYDAPTSLFMDDVPPFYDTTDVTACVYPASVTLTEGDSITLLGGSKAAWFTSDGNWESENPSIATVVGGAVKAMKAGTTHITVTTNGGQSTAYCAVTIMEKPVSINIKNLLDPVHIYPNPAQNGFVCIDFGNSSSEKAIRVLNIQGQTVMAFNTNLTTYTIGTSVLHSGMYMLSVTSAERSGKYRLMVQ